MEGNAQGRESLEETLPQQIADQIRRDILRGKLAPGAVIKERDSALEMGVSRTPMREAIRMLAKEGLVLLRPSRSPIVARLSRKDVSDQAVVLVALEQLSAELACKNATQEDLDEIEKILDYMAENFDRKDPLEIFEVDMTFHSAIARASHNQVLADTHRAILQRLWRARYISAVQRRNRERVINQHRGIFEGLKLRDPAVVRAALDMHLAKLDEDIGLAIAEEEAELAKSGRKKGETL